MPVDPQKIEQQLAAMIANLVPYSEGAGPNNVIARMQIQVVPALIRWKAGEMNRGSSENAVLNAFVALVSSQMVGLVGETIGVPDYGDRHFEMANTLLRAIGEEIGALMTGAREMHTHHVPAERAH